MGPNFGPKKTAEKNTVTMAQVYKSDISLTFTVAMVTKMTAKIEN